MRASEIAAAASVKNATSREIVSENASQHSMWLLLVILYSIICGVVLLQTLRIAGNGHSIYSFQGGFLMLTLVWAGLRIIFWTFDTGSASIKVQLTLYWSPTVLQFATFALLLMYYLKIVYIRRWPKIKCRLWLYYTASVVATTVALLLWLYFCQVQSKISYAAMVYAVGSGFLFRVLVVLLVLYGWRVYHIRFQQRRQTQLQQHFASATFVVCLTLMVFIVFITLRL